jgi:signal transduction histidine kinase
LTLVVAALAYFFYREQTREVREAQQRVSFVNQVSHELKTPLTNIRLYAELLEDELPESDRKQRAYLATIVDESQRLSRLIANVLAFGRQQREGLAIHPRPGMPDEVIRGVTKHFAPALEQRGIRVDLQTETPAACAFDPDVVEQILGNLLSNVEKYARDATRVIVGSHRDGDQLVITVRDDGPGIASREQERIFEPYYRVSDRLTDGVAGAGIGLAIARELAQRHGGRLDLLSQPEGSKTGAAFECVLHAPLTESDT